MGIIVATLIVVAVIASALSQDTEWPWGVIAAWVQAVGTIVAFGGAIYFSRRDHQRSIRMFEDERGREEGIRHLRAHSLAHALYPDLLEVKAIIKVSEAAISRQRARENPLPENLTLILLLNHKTIPREAQPRKRSPQPGKRTPR